LGATAPVSDMLKPTLIGVAVSARAPDPHITDMVTAIDARHRANTPYRVLDMFLSPLGDSY
jgi:hypothetical protein